MMYEVQIFRNKQFCDIKVVMQDNEPWFVAKDIADVLEFRDSNDMTRYLEADELRTYPDNSSGQVRHVKIINESGLYCAILRSRKPEAKKFRKWITSEVIPIIRKTGGFVNDNKAFIETYLPFADETTRTLFNAVLNVVKQQNRTMLRQNHLINHKESIINGLTQDITLAEKRQIINRIIKQAKGNYAERWNILYAEFDAKYHMNVKSRLKTYNETHKPKLKNSMEFIDKVLCKIPELFEVACKLFESEVECLINEMYRLRNTEISDNI